MGLIALNRPWGMLIAIGSGLVVNVALNLIWVPKWGFMGAVYGKLVAEVVVFCVVFGLLQLAVRGSFFPKWMIKPIAAGVVMTFVMIVSLPLGMIPAIVIGLGAYILSYLATGLLKARLPDSV
jgi:O-antigen/teichoic acid export membrane protein